MSSSRAKGLSRENRLLTSSRLYVGPCLSTGLPLDGTSYCGHIRKSVEKIVPLLQSDKNMAYLTWRTTFFLIVVVAKMVQRHWRERIVVFPWQHFSFCTLLTSTYVVREYKGKVLLVSMATVVTRTHQCSVLRRLLVCLRNVPLFFSIFSPDVRPRSPGL